MLINTYPRFLYFRCKLGVTFSQSCFRDFVSTFPPRTWNIPQHVPLIATFLCKHFLIFFSAIRLLCGMDSLMNYPIGTASANQNQALDVCKAQYYVRNSAFCLQEEYGSVA